MTSPSATTENPHGQGIWGRKGPKDKVLPLNPECFVTVKETQGGRERKAKPHRAASLGSGLWCQGACTSLPLQFYSESTWKFVPMSTQHLIWVTPLTEKQRFPLHGTKEVTRESWASGLRHVESLSLTGGFPMGANEAFISRLAAQIINRFNSQTEASLNAI